MVRYEEWIERAKGSLELAQTKITRHIFYEDLCYQYLLKKTYLHKRKAPVIIKVYEEL